MVRGRARKAALRPQRLRVRASTLDVRAVEAIARVVRVLARCGCAPNDIELEVQKACRAVPKAWALSARTPVSQIDAASHVLTLWFSDPAYLNSSGRPRPLRAKGGNRSLEALVLQVDPKLDVEEVLRHLRRGSALRQVGTRYVPRDRLVSVRGSGPPYHAWSLQTLVSMLGNLEHNSRPQRSTPGWFTAFAVIPRFPVRELPAFDRWLRRAGNRFLAQSDTRMHDRERARRRGEPTVRLGVGVYRFEEEPLRPDRKVKRKKDAQK
jgi:Family of unknown function (DUF6502)